MLLDAGGRTDPYRTPRELGALLEHLPAGCALGRVQGGDAAWPVEAQLLREAEYTIRMVSWVEGGQKGKQPERIPLPRASGEVAAEQAVLSAKAEAYARREARRQNSPID